MGVCSSSLGVYVAISSLYLALSSSASFKKGAFLFSSRHFHFSLQNLESSLKLGMSSVPFSLFCIRMASLSLCTKKAYAVILPFGFLGSFLGRGISFADETGKNKYIFSHYTGEQRIL